MTMTFLKRRLRLGLFLCTLAVTLVVGGVSANAATPTLQVRSAVAVDATTGQLLYQKSDQRTLPIASLTKLLSTYIVLQQIKAGKLHWNQRVAVSPAIAKMSRNSELTNVPLSAKRTYTVRELYQATLIYSANGAITALGNAVSGTPHKFVAKMRTTARQLHLTSAHLITASGITNGQAGQLGYSQLSQKNENTMSARDVARLSIALLKAYPEVLATTSRATAWFDKGGSSQTRMTNWNQMLKGRTAYDAKWPVDGLKTGTSTAAGGNFVGTVSKNGHRIITVVMHARNKTSSDPSRFLQTRKLMNWVYASYHPVTLNSATYQQSVKTPMGKSLTTNATVSRPTTVWLTAGKSRENLTSQFLVAADHREKGGLKAPVAAGQTFGNVALTLDGKSIETVEPTAKLRLPVKTIVHVQQANWFVRTWRTIVSWF